MKVCIVTMYRFGDREKHSYVHGIYDNSDEAILRAKEERTYRGGKYQPEVIEWLVGTPKTSEQEGNWHKLLTLTPDKMGS